MSTLELELNMLVEATTAELSNVHNPQGLQENQKIARCGGKITGDASLAIEKDTERPLVTSQNAAELNTAVVSLIEDIAAKAEKCKE